MFHITHLRFGDMTGYFPEEKAGISLLYFPSVGFFILVFLTGKGPGVERNFNLILI